MRTIGRIRRRAAERQGISCWERLIWGVMLVALVSLAPAQPVAAQEEPSLAPTPTPASRLAGPQPEITVISRIGFDTDLSMVKRGCWARISVLLTNDLKPVEGHLRIRKRERETIIYQQRIDLPLPSRKLWTGYLLADEMSNDPRSNELLVEYYTIRGRLLASEPVTYASRPPEDDLVLAIVPILQRSGLRSLINITSRDLRSSAATDEPRESGRRARYLLFTDKALLPREVIGYESVSAFLWDGGDLAELDPERSLALRGWVYAGGTLIVAGGESTNRVKQSFLNEILPVEILDTVSADVTDDFRQRFGSAPATSGPVLISLVRATRGQTLMGTAERPLIVEGSYGAGRVVFIAFSLTSWALQRWDGRDLLIAKWFKATRSRILSTISADGRWAMDVRLKSNLLAELPKPFFLIAFLGLYILLVVPVNYFVFRAFKRVEYAWFALPVVAIVFGFFAYHIGYFSQSRTLDADEISLVEGVAGSPLATAKTFYAIYSPTGTNEPIRFPDRPVLSRPLLAVGFAGSRFASYAGDPMGLSRNPLTVTYGNGFDVFDFVINPWAARSLECDHVADLGGQIDAQLTLEGNTLNGTITNRLGYPLNDAGILFPSGRLYKVDTLEPKQSRTVRAMVSGRSEPSVPRAPTGPSRFAPGTPPDTIEGQALRTWMRDVLNQTRRRTGGRGDYQMAPEMSLFQTAGVSSQQSWFGSSYAQVVPPNACLLLAWSPRSVIQPVVGEGRVKRTLNHRSQTLIHMIVLPIDTSVGRLTAVNEMFWSVQPLSRKMGDLQGRDYATEEYLRERGVGGEVFRLAGGENILAIRPSFDLTGRTLDSLTLTFRVEKRPTYRPSPSATNWEMTSGFTVALYDFTRAAWEPCGSSKMIEFKNDTNRFFNAAAQEMRIKIEVTDPDIQPTADGRQRAQMNCFLRDVRVNATLQRTADERR